MLLTSPNVSQPRSSVLRMPYSADHRVRGNYHYHSTPTQPFREMDSDEEVEEEAEEGKPESQKGPNESF